MFTGLLRRGDKCAVRSRARRRTRSVFLDRLGTYEIVVLLCETWVAAASSLRPENWACRKELDCLNVLSVKSCDDSCSSWSSPFLL